MKAKPKPRPAKVSIQHLPLPDRVDAAMRQRLRCAHPDGCSEPAEVETRTMSGAIVVSSVTHCSPHWTNLYAGGPAFVDGRAAHRAVRSLVEAAGKDFARDLYKAFTNYNNTYFAGGLKPPMLLVTQTSSPRALGDYMTEDNQGLQSVIRLSPKSVSLGPLFARDVLLHEMIHAWQHEVSRDMEDGYRGHGPAFAGKCNEIGQAFGLAEVSPKGRGGKADCAAWPLNVRPAGYYGEGDVEEERKKREPKPKRTERTEADDGPPADGVEERRRRAFAEIAALCEQTARDIEKTVGGRSALSDALVLSGAHFADLARGGETRKASAPALAAE
jgi:hypothetical protein